MQILNFGPFAGLSKVFTSRDFDFAQEKESVPSSSSRSPLRWQEQTSPES